MALIVAGFVAAGPGAALAASPGPDPHGTPEVRSTPTPSATPTARPTPRPTPTPTPSERPTPTPSPIVHPTPGESITLKSSILAAIDRRQTTIRSLKSAVTDSRALTDADRAALRAQLDATAAGLATLSQQVASETNAAALQKDAAAVVNDYRVDDLLDPKVRLVIAADSSLQTATSATSLVARFLEAISREKAAGRDTAAAEAQVADMQVRIAAARTAAAGVPALVLPLAPAGFPGNKPTLASARALIESARASLHAAGDDAHRAAESLNLLTQADLRSYAAKMIAERQTTLELLAAHARASKTLTDEDRSQLLTLITTDQAGLAALGRRIPSDTSVKALQADINSIYTDYRIYALVVPKVELTIAADSLSAGTTKMDAAGRRIAELIAKAHAAGRDTAEAQAALDGLIAHDNAARAKLTGVTVDLIGLTTALYPANQAALASDRRSIADARSELSAAGRDARRAIQALK